jgi:hypothetical protein
LLTAVAVAAAATVKPAPPIKFLLENITSILFGMG